MNLLIRFWNAIVNMLIKAYMSMKLFLIANKAELMTLCLVVLAAWIIYSIIDDL